MYMQCVHVLARKSGMVQGFRVTLAACRDRVQAATTKSTASKSRQIQLHARAKRAQRLSLSHAIAPTMTPLAVQSCERALHHAPSRNHQTSESRLQNPR
jgi:hypothetical protein